MSTVVNEKNFEISDKLGQNLSVWQIYPSTESSKESLKRISKKIDFNVVRDPNIPVGLINHEENVFFSNSVIQVLYSLPLFRDYISKLGSLAEGVAMEIKKLFKEIETSIEPVRTSNYVKYLSLQGHEPGIQCDPHECLLQLLAKLYHSINDGYVFNIDKLASTLCIDCGYTTNNDGECIDWYLHVGDSSNI